MNPNEPNQNRPERPPLPFLETTDWHAQGGFVFSGPCLDNARYCLNMETVAILDDQDDKALATRIAACLNACRDIPTDELEQRGLAGLCERQRNCCEANVRWEMDYLELEQLDDIAKAIQGASLVSDIAPLAMNRDSSTEPLPVKALTATVSSIPGENGPFPKVRKLAGYGEPCDDRR